MLTKLCLMLMLLLIDPAQALEAKVKMACAGDYFEHCSHTVPGSAECKQCFKEIGVNLSSRCKNAIRESEEFARDYQEQRHRYVRR